jgi:hypothetical protein
MLRVSGVGGGRGGFLLCTLWGGVTLWGGGLRGVEVGAAAAVRRGRRLGGQQFEPANQRSETSSSSLVTFSSPPASSHRQHMSAYVRIRPHTSAYARTASSCTTCVLSSSAYASIREAAPSNPLPPPLSRSPPLPSLLPLRSSRAQRFS